MEITQINAVVVRKTIADVTARNYKLKLSKTKEEWSLKLATTKFVAEPQSNSDNSSGQSEKESILEYWKLHY